MLSAHTRSGEKRRNRPGGNLHLLLRATTRDLATGRRENYDIASVAIAMSRRCRHNRSRHQAPPPTRKKVKKKKQYTASSWPPLTAGKKLRARRFCTMRNATAISPDMKKAAQRV